MESIKNSCTVFKLNQNIFGQKLPDRIIEAFQNENLGHIPKFKVYVHLFLKNAKKSVPFVTNIEYS